MNTVQYLQNVHDIIIPHAILIFQCQCTVMYTVELEVVASSCCTQSYVKFSIVYIVDKARALASDSV